jgi:hypothetical protein
MKTTAEHETNLDIEFLHEIGTGISAAPLSKVLDRIVRFVAAVMKCDSCFVYILNDRDLVLRASKNLHAEAVDRWQLRERPTKTRDSNLSTNCPKTNTRRFCRFR